MKFRVVTEPGFYDGKRMWPVGSVLETSNPSRTFAPLDEEAVAKLQSMGVKTAAMPKQFDPVATARERVAEAQANLEAAESSLNVLLAQAEAKAKKAAK
jgi:hypothetical protein